MPVHRTVRKRGENHEVVMAVLGKTGQPQTAYEILDRLRPQGITSPPTVYRALERLLAEGRIHRLESLNAFVPCCHTHQGRAAVFTICDDCGHVEELADTALDASLVAAARRSGFALADSLVEMHGTCRGCTQPQTTGAAHSPLRKSRVKQERL